METGHNQAQELFDHLDAMLRTALYMTPSREQAERVVEDTIEQLYRYRQQSNGDHAGKTGAFSVLVSQILEKYHVPIGMRPGLSQGLSNIRETLGDLADPDQTTNLAKSFAETSDEEVVASIKRLPMDCRLFVVLLFIEKFTYREIADMVGIPVQSVRGNLTACRQALMQDLLGEKMTFSTKITNTAPDAE